MAGASKKRHSTPHTTSIVRSKQQKVAHPSTHSPTSTPSTQAIPLHPAEHPTPTLTTILLQPPTESTNPSSPSSQSQSPSPSPTPTPASTSHAAHRAYLAHTAPHLFSEHAVQNHLLPLQPSPSPSSSRSPSPTLGSSPRHAYDHQSSSLPRQSHSHQASPSRYVVPHKYRGPLPRDTDAALVAPHPSLQPAPTSSPLAADHLYTVPNTPLNRNSWRYTFAGPDTTLHPTSVYKSIPSTPHQVRWDWSDRSPFTQISKQAHVVTSQRGWRSARGNVPVRHGSWYCEIQVLHPDIPLSVDSPSGSASAIHPASPIDTPTPSSHPHHSHLHGLAHSSGAPMKDGSHVRVGWGRREAPLNAPVGFDGYSYGLRDTTGQRVFLSRPTPFSSRSFAPGDTIGLYIRLPPLTSPSPRDPKDPRHVRRKWIPIRYRGQVYFEQLDYTQTREMERLLEKSWSGEKILRPDGGLSLRRIKSSTSRPENQDEEWVEIDEANGNEGEDEEGDLPSRVAGGSGAKMKKQKAVKKASSTPTPAPGGATSKGGNGGGAVSAKGAKKKSSADAAGNTEDDKKQKKRRTLRPLPTFGPSSRIGFFLNGEPLGWAFRDLLDFRPLRQAGGPAVAMASGAPPSDVEPVGKSKKGGADTKKQGGGVTMNGHSNVLPSQLDPSSLVSLSALDLGSGQDKVVGIEDQNRPSSDTTAGTGGDGDDGGVSGGIDFLSSAPLLTSSASLSTIMKSRENPYDDGCCGYFPMVSLYGGARARLIAKEEEMKFLPPGGLRGVERALEMAERRKGQTDRIAMPGVPTGVGEVKEESWWGKTRPLEELYLQHWDQQRLLDLQEEERAKARAKWIKTLVEEDEDEEMEEEEQQQDQVDQVEQAAAAEIKIEIDVGQLQKAHSRNGVKEEESEEEEKKEKGGQEAGKGTATLSTGSTTSEREDPSDEPIADADADAVDVPAKESPTSQDVVMALPSTLFKGV